MQCPPQFIEVVVGGLCLFAGTNMEAHRLQHQSLGPLCWRMTSKHIKTAGNSQPVKQHVPQENVIAR